ncbi:MAG: glycoside hydrolase family 16 protein [Prevotella sp.]|nr:glycoside hydrolase family 16 protein [Prevotella sp.]
MKGGILLLLALLGLTADSTMVKAQKTEWTLVFSDEFNQPNGSQPDPAKWSRAGRNPSQWARWNSKSDKVVYIKNGSLVCRAVPNKWEPADTAKMLTGGVTTMNKFEFKYGKVEVRMKTNFLPGNFPAIWLMKSHGYAKELYGEIDIAEVFSNQKKASHTIHSQYTQTHKTHGLKNTFSKEVDVRKWHIYGVEWTPDHVIWTIDGETTGIYKKPKDKLLLDEGAWTFDYPFFLILNQAVGSGRWKALPYPDIRKTFETRFDWVRVYQSK